jgi:hypothetical protein
LRASVLMTSSTRATYEGLQGPMRAYDDNG